jgi:hypothetical protein
MQETRAKAAEPTAAPLAIGRRARRGRALRCGIAGDSLGTVQRIPAYRSTTRPRLPQAVAAAAHWVLAVAVLFGVLHSGSRYFYCEALGLLPSDPCAAASSDAHSKTPLQTLSERAADCCEIVTLGAMPPAAQAAGPSVAPAARVAIVPASWLAGGNDLATAARVDRAFERWRPPPRASSEARAELMVFLI